MKRFLLILCFFPAVLTLRAQDAGGDAATASPAATAKPATPGPSQEEIDDRFKRLQGQVDDMLKAQASLDSTPERLKNLEQQIAALREQQAHPNTSGQVTQDDWKRLNDRITEVDENRVKDLERFKKELMEQLSHMMNVAPPPPTGPTHMTQPVDSGSSGRGNAAHDSGPAPDRNGYYYEIKKGDLISTIAESYRQQGIKVTSQEILDANAGLKANRLIVGKKIFIPADSGKPK